MAQHVTVGGPEGSQAGKDRLGFLAALAPDVRPRLAEEHGSSELSVVSTGLVATQSLQVAPGLVGVAEAVVAVCRLVTKLRVVLVRAPDQGAQQPQRVAVVPLGEQRLDHHPLRLASLRDRESLHAALSAGEERPGPTALSLAGEPSRQRSRETSHVARQRTGGLRRQRLQQLQGSLGVVTGAEPLRPDGGEAWVVLVEQAGGVLQELLALAHLAHPQQSLHVREEQHTIGLTGVAGAELLEAGCGRSDTFGSSAADAEQGDRPTHGPVTRGEGQRRLDLLLRLGRLILLPRPACPRQMDPGSARHRRSQVSAQLERCLEGLLGAVRLAGGQEALTQIDLQQGLARVRLGQPSVRSQSLGQLAQGSSHVGPLGCHPAVVRLELGRPIQSRAGLSPRTPTRQQEAQSVVSLAMPGVHPQGGPVRGRRSSHAPLPLMGLGEIEVPHVGLRPQRKEGLVVFVGLRPIAELEVAAGDVVVQRRLAWPASQDPLEDGGRPPVVLALVQDAADVDGSSDVVRVQLHHLAKLAQRLLVLALFEVGVAQGPAHLVVVGLVLQVDPQVAGSGLVVALLVEVFAQHEGSVVVRVLVLVHDSLQRLHGLGGTPQLEPGQPKHMQDAQVVGVAFGRGLQQPEPVVGLPQQIQHVARPDRRGRRVRFEAHRSAILGQGSIEGVSGLAGLARPASRRCSLLRTRPKLKGLVRLRGAVEAPLGPGRSPAQAQAEGHGR